MKIYVTSYRASLGSQFGSKIVAPSLAEARRRAHRRGLGEKVLGTGRLGIDVPASRVLRSRRSPVVKLHALAFLGLIAIKAGVANVEDFLDDELGVLHQWAHLETARARGRRLPGLRPTLLALVDRIERRIPGYPCR